MELLEILKGILYVAVTIGITVSIKVVLVHIKLTDKDGVIKDFIDVVHKVVDETTQTYVQSLKNSGSFTEDAQKEAFSKSYDKAVSMMSSETQKFIEERYGDIGEWLTTIIESYLKTNKGIVKSKEKSELPQKLN
jgi:hypothetical protein